MLATDDGKTPPPIPDKYLRKAYQATLDMGGVTPDALRNPKVIDFVRQVNKRLSAPIDRVPLSEHTAQRIREDVYIFSGFHTYHELKEASERMIDKNGNVKDFETYYRDTKKVRDKYNKAWLRAEYNYAVRAAESSAKWEEYVEGKDSYDLQYVTAGDSRVRADHVALDGVTLPVDDPFWSIAYPPNGWNCRCTVIKVPKGSRPLSNSDRCIKAFEGVTTGRNEMWRCNTAQQGVLFPRKHPYYSKRGIDHCNNPKLSANLGKNEECEVLAELKHSSNKQEQDRYWRLKAKTEEKKKKGAIPQSGLYVENDTSISKRMCILRRSIGDIIGHAPHDQVVLKWISEVDISKPIVCKKFLGWGYCKEDKRGRRKHPEAEGFLYYSIEIDGETRYLHVKAHRHSKSEVPYCILTNKPTKLSTEPIPQEILDVIGLAK